jgi:hypothetical protein
MIEQLQTTRLTHNASISPSRVVKRVHFVRRHETHKIESDTQKVQSPKPTHKGCVGDAKRIKLKYASLASEIAGKQ